MKSYLLKAIGFLSILFLLTLASCSSGTHEISQRKSDILQKYLDEKVMQPIWGGKVFSAFKIFEEVGDTLYIWAYIQEYYKEENNIELGTGWSVPMVISIEDTLSEITIKKLFIPGDGDMYEKDIKKNFPGNIQKEVLDFQKTPDIKELTEACKKRAEAFYK